MVKVEHHKDEIHLYLLPNRSATWRQTKLAIGAVSLTTLAVATFWSLQGFWMILPFAGLEVAIFSYLAYRVCSATYHQQVVLCSRDDIEVQWGSTFPKQRWNFNRRDTELEVVRPPHSWSPYRLLLKDGRQTLPIADKLNKEDVQQTLDQFRAMGFFPVFTGKTSTVAIEGFDL